MCNAQGKNCYMDEVTCFTASPEKRLEVSEKPCRSCCMCKGGEGGVGIKSVLVLVSVSYLSKCVILCRDFLNAR